MADNVEGAPNDRRYALLRREKGWGLNKRLEIMISRNNFVSSEGQSFDKFYTAIGNIKFKSLSSPGKILEKFTDKYPGGTFPTVDVVSYPLSFEATIPDRFGDYFSNYSEE